MTSGHDAEVERLLESIEEKLRANKDILVRSLRYGRIVWRSKNGVIEVDLEPKI